MSHIKTFASGPQAKISQLLLNQLSEARVCLCSKQSRQAYDLQLQKQISPTGASVNPAVQVDKSSARRTHSGSSSTLWVGLLLLAASLIVCYLAFTQGWVSPENLKKDLSKFKPDVKSLRPQADTAKDESNDPDNAQASPDEPTPQDSNRGSPATDNSARNIDDGNSDEEPRGDGSLRTGDEAAAPVKEQESESPRGEPPTNEFYNELDKAFGALLNYDYVKFTQFRTTADKIYRDRNLDKTTVEKDFSTIDEIGESFVNIWKLVDGVIPNLTRKEVITLADDSKVRIVTAVPGRIQVEYPRGREDGKRTEDFRKRAGELPIYTNMPPGLATYLAERAIKENLMAGVLNLPLAQRGVDFFRSINVDELPGTPRRRWSVVQSEWESNKEANN